MHSVSNQAATEAFYKTSEETLRSNVPPSPENPNRTPSTISSTSSSEEEPSEFTLKERSIKKDLLGNELYTPDKILPHTPQPDDLCMLLKDRSVEKVARLDRVTVLPPVKVPTSRPNANPNRLNPLLKGRGYSATRPIIFSEKARVDGDQDKAVVIYCSRPTAGTSQGPGMSKQELTQHQYHLLSAFSKYRRYQIPINTSAETQCRATSLPERNLRQEELIRSPVRHNSRHRSQFGLKDKSLRRAEPNLLMLLGTSIQMPVSTQRVL